MPALTPQIVTRLEDNISTIMENEYVRLSQDRWVDQVVKFRPMGNSKEQVAFNISTAMLHDLGITGEKMVFEDAAAMVTEIENRFAGDGLRLNRRQLEDLNGNGFEVASERAAEWAALAAYWPQQKAAEALMAGNTSAFKAYDGLNYFASNHPLNPKNSGSGQYSNLITGVPIHGNVDTALTSIQTVFTHIASIKMPNGKLPRKLRPKAILAGPMLFPRAVQLTNAKFLAQAATGGGAATADVELLIKSLGYAQPYLADEFVGYGSDQVYFVVAEQAQSSQLGGIIYSEVEPFKVDFYDTLTEAQLGRMNTLEWHFKGFNKITAGHPFLIFRCSP